MPNRRLLVLSAAVGLWVTGCQQNKPNTAQLPPQNSITGPIDAQAKDSQTAESAEAIAWKAQNYAKEIAPLIEARTATAPRGSITGGAVATAPSQVTWLDPADFRLGGPAAIKSDETRSAPAVKPVIMTTPGSANQGAITVEPAAKPPAGTPAPSKMEIATADPAVQDPKPVRAVSQSTVTSDVLADKLSRKVKDYPRDVAAQLEYQMFEFLRDESAPQLSTLSALPSEDRELVSAVMDGLANLRNALRADSNMLLSRKIKPMLDMSERLRSQSDLTIPTMALCKSVTNFATFEPIEPARFVSSVDHQVIVYCEVGNFTSNLNDKQLWETRLTWDLTLFTDQGLQVWSDKTETITDAARSRRRDFFVRKIITLPKNLSVGRYLLKASLVDTQSNRVAEATTPIVIVVQQQQ